MLDGVRKYVIYLYTIVGVWVWTQEQADLGEGVYALRFNAEFK